jgi:hypothetical protein
MSLNEAFQSSSGVPGKRAPLLSALFSAALRLERSPKRSKPETKKYLSPVRRLTRGAEAQRGGNIFPLPRAGAMKRLSPTEGGVAALKPRLEGSGQKDCSLLSSRRLCGSSGADRRSGREIFFSVFLPASWMSRSRGLEEPSFKPHGPSSTI